MKILAFTDIHGSNKKVGYVAVSETLKRLDKFKKIIKQEKIEYVICCGDFTFFNEYVEELLEKIAELPVPVLLIHGNHEDEMDVKMLSKQYPNIHYIHKKAKVIGNYAFLGYGGDGFSRRSPDFVNSMHKAMEKLPKKTKYVLITHGPPHGTKADFRPGYGHVGNLDYREFIEKHPVILSLCGHIHEGFDTHQKVSDALVINPGPEGKIIELE